MTGGVLAITVATAGGVGSALRYLVDAVISRRYRGRRWGTALVNLTGSFALGVLVGLGAPGGAWATVAATGLLGGYTTFSTASLEALQLIDERRRLAGTVASVAMFAACTFVAWVGIVCTS